MIKWHSWFSVFQPRQLGNCWYFGRFYDQLAVELYMRRCKHEAIWCMLCFILDHAVRSPGRTAPCTISTAKLIQLATHTVFTFQMNIVGIGYMPNFGCKPVIVRRLELQDIMQIVSWDPWPLQIYPSRGWRKKNQCLSECCVVYDDSFGEGYIINGQRSYMSSKMNHCLY